MASLLSRAKQAEVESARPIRQDEYFPRRSAMAKLFRRTLEMGARQR